MLKFPARESYCFTLIVFVLTRQETIKNNNIEQYHRRSQYEANRGTRLGKILMLEDFIRLISYNGPCVRLGCSFFLATALNTYCSRIQVAFLDTLRYCTSSSLKWIFIVTVDNSIVLKFQNLRVIVI